MVQATDYWKSNNPADGFNCVCSMFSSFSRMTAAASFGEALDKAIAGWICVFWAYRFRLDTRAPSLPIRRLDASGFDTLHQNQPAV
jgi:hypothetical protein